MCGGADSPDVLLSGQNAACWPLGSQKTGAVGAWGRAGETGQASSYLSTLAKYLVTLHAWEGTRTSRETEDGTSLLSSRDTENEFIAAYEGKPGVQGHLGQKGPEGEPSLPDLPQQY